MYSPSLGRGSFGEMHLPAEYWPISSYPRADRLQKIDRVPLELRHQHPSGLEWSPEQKSGSGQTAKQGPRLRDARRALRLVWKKVRPSLLSGEIVTLPPARSPQSLEWPAEMELLPGEVELFVVRQPER
jgi:hypothetical protein